MTLFRIKQWSRSLRSGPRPAADGAGRRLARHVRFASEELDLYFQAFALGYVTYGGASIGEVFHVAAQIDERDLEIWVTQWHQAGARAEEQAVQAEARGHAATAREAWLRAFTYHRTAGTCLRPADPRFRESHARSRACFRRAAALFDPPVSALTIGTGDGALPAYLMRPTGADGRRPTMIVIGGGDTYAEDLYFWGGAAGTGRGWNVLAVDLPGQGATALDGMHYRPDVEVPFAAVIDEVLRRPDVDPDRLAVYGVSLGGYIVMRAASKDRRIKACAASTPIMDWRALLLAAAPLPVRANPKLLDVATTGLSRFFGPAQRIAYEKFFQWQVGAPTMYRALEMFRAWTVDVEAITCPVLCLVGDGEGAAFRRQAQQVYDRLNVRKDIVHFTAQTGADAHSQANNLRLAHATVFDWLEEALTGSPEPHVSAG